MNIDVNQLFGLVAGSAVIAALLTHYLGQSERERNKRRKLYAEAIQAALGWREMLYRVRRRQSGSDDERAITLLFHDLQERLDYYDGLIWSHSPSLGRSYRKLVKQIRNASQPLIQEAWKNNPIKPQDYDPSALKNPKFKKQFDDFLEDVVRQTKPKYHVFAKLKLWWKNRDDS